jgi:hypothetical protein
MAVTFAVEGVEANRLILRATAGAASDTGTRTNTQLKADFPNNGGILARLLHSTNTVANSLRNNFEKFGRLTYRAESDDTSWAVNITEGAGPAFALQLDVIGGDSAADTALIYVEGVHSMAR